LKKYFAKFAHYLKNMLKTDIIEKHFFNIFVQIMLM